jgi:hypothetical protein
MRGTPRSCVAAAFDALKYIILLFALEAGQLQEDCGQLLVWTFSTLQQPSSQLLASPLRFSGHRIASTSCTIGRGRPHRGRGRLLSRRGRPVTRRRGLDGRVRPGTCGDRRSGASRRRGVASRRRRRTGRLRCLQLFPEQPPRRSRLPQPWARREERC